MLGLADIPAEKYVSTVSITTDEPRKTLTTLAERQLDLTE